MIYILSNNDDDDFEKFPLKTVEKRKGVWILWSPPLFLKLLIMKY